MYDASNRKDIRRAEKAARLAARNRAEITASLMSTPAGREWMCDILQEFNIFALTTFSPNPGAFSFNEGQRSAGQRLLNDILRACPEQFIQMLREKEQRDVARERDPDQPGDGDDGAADDSANAGDGIRDEARD